MGLKNYALYALFIACGIVTMRYLKRKQMYVAHTLYAALFVVLLAYLPYVVGSRLMLRILSHFVHEVALDTLEVHIMSPLVASMPWFTVSFIVAIVASVAMCLVMAILAVKIYRHVVRSLRAHSVLRFAAKPSFVCLRAAHCPQARAARYRYCRYNC